MSCRLVLPCLLLAAVLPCAAQRGSRSGLPGEAPPAAVPAAPAAPAAAPAKPPEEKTSQTQHTVRIAGQEVKYTATAGTLVQKKEDGTATASIFYVAYTKDGAGDPARRPLTFSFNGGPGSSSVWLQLGMLGPKRVAMQPNGLPTPPPYRLIDNEFSILDLTDLVFIDPVSTGFSRAVSDAEAKNFHGVTGDLQSVAEFIRLYTSRHERWASPKFLAGESYGTTRAAGLSGYLQQRLGMNLNGIVLISAVLNFETVHFDTGNDLPYALFLPTYTATAWYHKKLARDLQSQPLKKVLEETERFASGEFTLALMKGDTLPDKERAQVAQKVARLTGLAASYVEASNLRISIQRFVKELKRGERRTVGRYDSRMEGIDLDAAGERPEYDPSYATVQGPFTAAVNQYLRADLKFTSDLPYEILTGRVQPWSYTEYQNRYVNMAETLRQAMTQNPSLKVFVANGYYDLATPYFATLYTFRHLGLDRGLRDHVSMGFYEAGHMIYTNLPSLQAARGDLAGFLAGCLTR
jgi:carboxypeptidase C (cathepsin A)